MATEVMAIFQDVDKCMKCNGCVIGCKRTWKMKAETIGVHKVAYDQRLAIKSIKRVDVGPFQRWSCWHCPDPPCVKRCPFKALTKMPNGAVNIDPSLCNPAACDQQCRKDCQRGGYPKIGVGSDNFASAKAWKCTLCYGRAGEDSDLDPDYGPPNPTRATAAEIGALPDRAHEPTCVYTCPAKTMFWDTRANIINRIQTGGYISWQGDGSMWWASKKWVIVPPKADPLVEDHISPMVSSLMSSPFAKAAMVGTLVAGGLLAISARRTANEQAAPTLGEV